MRTPLCSWSRAYYSAFASARCRRESRVVKFLLTFSHWIDQCNERVGLFANWAVLLACLISAGNAMMRYGFDLSSNAWLEIQWYLFAAVVMLGAAFTLRRNEHVRVDIFYGQLSARGKAWLDLIGSFLFLLPFCLFIGALTWPVFLDSWMSDEASGNAGGLVRWPFKLLLPLGFALLALQGLSEIIKRVAVIRGIAIEAAAYERPLQ